MKKIKLNSDLIEQLLVNGECSILGVTYEVSQMDGLYVSFDEGGMLRRVTAPARRLVGRPKIPYIRSRERQGLFLDKVGRFLIGDETESRGSRSRRVRILGVYVKKMRDVSEDELMMLGYEDASHSDLEELWDKNREIALYWYEEVES